MYVERGHEIADQEVAQHPNFVRTEDRYCIGRWIALLAWRAEQQRRVHAQRLLLTLGQVQIQPVAVHVGRLFSVTLAHHAHQRREGSVATEHSVVQRQSGAQVFAYLVSEQIEALLGVPTNRQQQVRALSRVTEQRHIVFAHVVAVEEQVREDVVLGER